MPTTWLFITACIHNRWDEKNAQKREYEYRTAITETLKHVPTDIRVVIIENSTTDKSFIQQFGEVFLTHNGNLPVQNKGMIELKDIQDTIRHYNIPDEDMIIKLTGRYNILNSFFFEKILRSSSDVLMKFFNVSTREFMKDDCVLGLYAVRAKYLKSIVYTDIGKLNSMEVDFAKYVRSHCHTIEEINTLGLLCRFAQTGEDFHT